MDPLNELNELKRKIEDYKTQATQHLLQGHVKDYESFREVVGKVAAFQYILDDIVDIQRKYIEE
jgi:methyl coenzyme M reductase subunit C-like uncharacterized protein (methanogenesis marker protein 7)